MTIGDNPAIPAMQELARRHDVVIPVPFYERDGARRFNSVAVIDAGGKLLGVYRKSHIPDFPAYEEAFYFDPGDTGFTVWDTKYVKLGCGICWDQWFPEAARAMALKGAELLAYPTAIGRPLGVSSYQFPDSKPHWQLTMQGHAAANMVIVAASNRIGAERGGGFTLSSTAAPLSPMRRARRLRNLTRVAKQSLSINSISTVSRRSAKVGAFFVPAAPTYISHLSARGRRTTC
jgi:N-carbamoylputrescine amidase